MHPTRLRFNVHHFNFQHVFLHPFWPLFCCTGCKGYIRIAARLKLPSAHGNRGELRGSGTHPLALEPAVGKVLQLLKTASLFPLSTKLTHKLSIYIYIYLYLCVCVCKYVYIYIYIDLSLSLSQYVCVCVGRL